MATKKKRKRITPRCYVLRADRNGRTWYVGYSRAGMTGVTDKRAALEFETLTSARLVLCHVIWPEWKIWRRGRR